MKKYRIILIDPTYGLKEIIVEGTDITNALYSSGVAYSVDVIKIEVIPSS